MGWQDKARETVAARKSGNALKLPEGESVLRIHPNKKGPDYPPYAETMVHREVGPNNSFVTCGKDVEGQGSCWLCDAKIPALKASASAANRLKADKMVAKPQIIFMASLVDRTGKFSAPSPFYQSGGGRGLGMTLLGFLGREGKNYEHPIRGRNFIIERTGTGARDTRYQCLGLEEEATKVPKEIFDRIKAFEEIVRDYDAERQKAAWDGRKFAGDEEDAPVAARRSARPAGRDPEDEAYADLPTDEATETTGDQPFTDDEDYFQQEEADVNRTAEAEAQEEDLYGAEDAHAEDAPVDSDESYYDSEVAETADPDADESYYDPEPEHEPAPQPVAQRAPAPAPAPQPVARRAPAPAPAPAPAVKRVAPAPAPVAGRAVTKRPVK